MTCAAVSVEVQPVRHAVTLSALRNPRDVLIRVGGSSYPDMMVLNIVPSGYADTPSVDPVCGQTGFSTLAQLFPVNLLVQTLGPPLVPRL